MEKYTIINSEKNTLFIQQNYDSLEDANKRLSALKQKFADRYPLAVVRVDEEGNFHKLSEEK